MWKAIVLATLPMPALAQGYGDVALTQTYSMVNMTGSFVDDPSLSVVQVKPDGAGGFVEFICNTEAADACWTIHYAEFGNAVAWGEADPRAPLSDVLAGLTPVETRDRVGGDVFPLTDGAEITWLEVWRSDGFDADYAMRLTVSCCELTQDNDLDLSDRVWTLTFTYANAGEIGVAHGGEITFHYDAEQNVVVDRTTSNWWEDEADRSLTFATLTGLRRAKD